MHKALNLAALNRLAKLEQRLQRDGSAAIKSQGKTAVEIIEWCIEQQLLPTHSIHLPSVQFTLPLLDDIAQTQQALGQACFRQSIRQQDRLEQSSHSRQEIKNAGASPREHRILLLLNHPQIAAELAPPYIVDTDLRQLQLTNFDALLIIENLDCFYQLERFSYTLPYCRPLITYRGDTLYSSGCKALCENWRQTGKPQIYFGDADLAGIRIALSLGCRSILLPELSQFQHTADTAMLDNKQLPYQKSLLAETFHPAFTPYQQLICQQLKGLRQQQMQGIPLIPVPFIMLPHSNDLAALKTMI